MKYSLLPIVVVGALLSGALAAPEAKKLPTLVPPTKPYVIEFYYKIRWGHQQEFLDLFKKNHLPLLKKQIEMGRILSVSATSPESHLPEDARWDYRITITFKDAVAAASELDEDALARQIFPNMAQHKKEEQQRFELMLAHWDVPLSEVELK